MPANSGASIRNLRQFDGLPLDEFIVTSPHNWRGEMEDIAGRPGGGGNYYPCAGLWTALSIAWDGKVICCTDLNGRQVFGDVTRQSLMDAWNSEEMRYHRRMQKEGRYKELPLCAECHATQLEHNSNRHILTHLPPFEQIKNGYYLLRRRRPGNASPARD